MFKKILSFAMVLLLFTTPLFTFANQTNIDDTKQAIADAKRDAARDANTLLWSVAGCGLGLVGIIIAGIYNSPVPAIALVGKSPTYVATYTTEYQRLMRNSQIEDAAVGCLGGCAVYGIGWWLLIALDPTPFYY